MYVTQSLSLPLSLSLGSDDFRRHLPVSFIDASLAVDGVEGALSHLLDPVKGLRCRGVRQGGRVLSRAQQLLSSLGIITSLIAFSFCLLYVSLFWHCACVTCGRKREGRGGAGQESGELAVAHV